MFLRLRKGTPVRTKQRTHVCRATRTSYGYRSSGAITRAAEDVPAMPYGPGDTVGMGMLEAASGSYIFFTCAACWALLASPMHKCASRPTWCM